MQKSEQKLGTLTNNDIFDVLVIANVSRPNNFESLKKDEWKWLCGEIKKDFGDRLTHGELIEIIYNGAKGKYNKTQFTINGFTIYKWIEIYMEIKKSMPKKELPCPPGIDSFYWTQMSERDQISWLKENLPNKVQN